MEVHKFAYECNSFVILESCFLNHALVEQGIWANRIIPTGRLHIMNQAQRKVRQYCMWGIFLMRMTIHFMTTPDGIPGEGSLRELLPINLGFGLQEIMKLILPQNL